MGKRTQADGASEAEAARPAKRSSRKKRKTPRIEAMSHPLRARILRLLSERDEMSPAGLSRALQADVSLVSYHMRRLEELECAEEVRTRPVRGALEHFYRATERPLVDTDEFEDLDPTTAEDLVFQAIQKIIDDFVGSRKAEMIGFDKNFHLTRTPLILDEEGLNEGMELFERCRLEMSAIELRSAERRSDSGAPGIPVSSSLLLFKVPRAHLDA